MAERILVPLDGSNLGEAALKYVSSLIANVGPKKKVTVILIHVINNLDHEVSVHGPGADTKTIPYTFEEIDEIKQEVTTYLTRASKDLQESGVEVKNKIIVGSNPAEEIIKAEEELECDLVAMSTHGRSGLSRFAFGSITDKVLRGGTVPVLLKRANG